MVYKNIKILDMCSVNSVKYLLEKKICIYDIDIFCLYFIIKYGFYICRCIIVLFLILFVEEVLIVLIKMSL